MLAHYLTRTIQERFKLALKVFIDIRNILYQYLNRHVFLSNTEMLSLSFFTQEATSLHCYFLLL